MSPDETARVLKARTPELLNVTCRQAPEGSSWDYDCSYSYATSEGMVRTNMGVDVDEDSIVGESHG
jgi:hypothetical protein